MELVPLLNSEIHLEIKSEEEVSNELLEDHHVVRSCPDPWSFDQKAQCGRILIKTTREYSVVCEVCRGRFDGLESFSFHLKIAHSDYGVHNDGWSKITITEEPTCKTEEIESKVDTKDNIAPESTGNRLLSEEKPVISVPKNITKKQKILKNCADNSRKPVVIVAAEPIYDEKRLFCITCNRHLNSKRAFWRHKYYHKERFRKLNDSKQENTSAEVAVKEEIDLGDYAMQGSVYETQSDEITDNGVCIDSHVKEMKSNSNDSVNCEFCSIQFGSEDGLRRHIAQDHGDKIPKSFEDDPTYLQCRFCFQQFEKPTERYEHENSHTREEKPFKCLMCPKSFTTCTKRKVHESLHRENRWISKEQVRIVFSENPKFDDKKRVCITCSRAFASKISFKSHKQIHRMRIHEKQDILKKVALSCEFCSKQFGSEDGLRRHIVRHHGDSIPQSLINDPTYLQCRFCFKQFEKPTERYQHEESHTYEDKPYRCPICSQFFTTLYGRKVHELIHRKDQCKRGKRMKITFSENPKFDEKKRLCITCNRGFASRISFKSHKQIHRMRILEKQRIVREATNSCEFCPRRFGSEKGLRRHIVRDHGDKIPAFLKDDPTYLQCRFCFKEFEKPTERYEHEKSHAKEQRPYHCSLCPLSFMRPCQRKIHELIHKEDGSKAKEPVRIVFSENPKFDDSKHFCITCNREFASRDSFKGHKQLHRMRIREKQGILPKDPISCEFCSRQFKSEASLRDHFVPGHGDKIPAFLKDDPTYLKCRFCHKQFEKPTERYEHEEIHSEEQRPYRCAFCPKSFTKAWKRESHQPVHREERLFRCLQCPNSYKIQQSLNRHVRSAHSTKPSETSEESFDSKSKLEAYKIVGDSALQPHMQPHALGTSCEKTQFETNKSIGVDMQLSSRMRATSPDSVQVEGATRNGKTTVCGENSQQREAEKDNDAESSTTPSTTFVMKPEYDEERNFCISCDLQLDSRKTFKAHKKWHRSKIRSWKLAAGLALPQKQMKMVFSENPAFDDEKNLCITCNREFSSRGSFQFHKYQHRVKIREKQGISTACETQIITMTCEFCSEQYQTNFGLREHLVTIHGDKIPKLLKDDPTYLQCKFCFKQFEKPTERYQHEKSHATEQKPFRCPLCPKSFATNSNRKAHESFHSEEKCKPSRVFALEPEFDDERNFCITCDRQLDSSKTLGYHKNWHRLKIREWKIAKGLASPTRKKKMKIVFSENPIFDEEKNFCITCNRGFPSRTSFKAHEARHKTKIREKQGISIGCKKQSVSIACEFCSERYQSNFRLRKHIVTRHGDKIPASFTNDPTYLECRFCHKQFEKPTERYEHEKSHGNEETPYRCSLCPKSFTQPLRRKIHELIHTDGGWRRKKHVKIEFSENPKYDNKKRSCVTCNRAFVSRNSFRCHKQLHTMGIRKSQGTSSEVVILCEFCSKQFRSQGALRRHLVQYHGDKIPTSLEDDPTYLKCRFCNKEFDKPTEHYEHEKSHAKEKKPYQCLLCPKTFSISWNLKNHQSLHRESRRKIVLTENPDFDDEKKLCITCNRTFASRSSLNTHKGLHKRLIRLKQDFGLKEHIAEHNGENIAKSSGPLVQEKITQQSILQSEIQSPQEI